MWSGAGLFTCSAARTHQIAGVHFKSCARNFSQASLVFVRLGTGGFQVPGQAALVLGACLLELPQDALVTSAQLMEIIAQRGSLDKGPGVVFFW